MELVLTRRGSGLYLLTKWDPIIVRVGVTGNYDAYARPGDPIAYYPVCDWSRRFVFDLPELETLESHGCELNGSPIGERYKIQEK